MADRRTYPDSCGMAQALNIIGERWAMLVVRELLLGPKRFADLNRELPGISKPVLSQRLDDLQERGVLRRRRLDPPVSAWVYELTEWGAELEPVVMELGRWGARSPFFDMNQPLSCASAAMSMRTMFSPEAGEHLEVSVDFDLGAERLHAEVRHGQLQVQRAAGEGMPLADAAVSTTPESLAAMLYAGLAIEDAESSGAAKVSGDRESLRAFLTCFRLPGPAKTSEPLRRVHARASAADRSEDLRARSRPVLDSRSPEEILGFDDDGLPT
ncbi:winged helix-turn-helix transcriptional regulator [Nesterenkonia sp.]|uniref:winged helix-turn-helix transcriptional regulator n=1 Tax=Nesterenkonia sp. TaxID=704201 RepID=UPI0026211DA3|nr:winged helix-turn-helix transcriptional regulator [Nesterenkonia sp.]